MTEQANEDASSPPSRWRGRVVALVAPFVVLPLLARLAVGPIGDALAAAVGHAAPRPASSNMAAVEEWPDEYEPILDVPPTIERQASEEAKRPRRVERWTPPPVASASPDGGFAEAGSIVISAALIEKALADKKIGARDVVDADGKPFGCRLHGVGKYRGGLRDGDIVIEVGGVRVHSTSEVIQLGLQQASGATRLTGKILRGSATFDVTLELPTQLPKQN